MASNRQRLINALQTQGLITAKGGLKAFEKAGPRMDLFFQQGSIAHNDLVDIFGAPEDFLNRMSDWQKKAEQAMATQLRVRGNQNVNSKLLARRSSMNLNMFNKETADELYESYVNDVLRIPQLLKKVGAPAVELPSGNLYRSAFKFMVEQTGPYHPAREVLNSMIINFNPSRVGMKSINISRSNILTHKTLKRMFEESAQKPSGNIFGSLSAGQKIITFDVETTGVFEGSQVRSMSASMMSVDASGKLVAPDSSQTRNLFMASKQLSGMTVSDTNNGLVSMNKFLAQIENDGKTSIDMADGGKKFLDEAEKFIQELLSADRLVAHNASFDITKMTETIEAQSAFGSHKGVQSALNQLYRKIDKGNYLVDTLGEARSYLQNQVEQIIQSSTATNVIQKSNQYVTSLYSQEILSTVHKGGSAAYASVENIALNTNLFELIENEGKAAELFKDIKKGSHVAKVDTLLQSYIAKYIHEGKLKISQLAQETINDFGRFARAKVFQSQAITPTTTIADVQHMSDTVFKNVDPKKVTLSISDQLANKYSGKVGPGILSYISQPTDLETTMMPSGKFQGEGYYLLNNINQTGQQTANQFTFTKVGDSEASSMIEDVLRMARSGDQGAVTPVNIGGVVQKINLEASSIIGTGWNYSQASAVNELEHIGALKIGKATKATDMQIIDAFSSVFKELGSGLDPVDQMRYAAGQDVLGSPFEAGMANYGLDVAKGIAKNFAAIGDPFAYMSMTDRVFSSVAAEATTGIAKAANIAGARAGYELSDIAFTATPKLTSALGIQVYEASKTARILDFGVEETNISKMRLPKLIAEQALERVSSAMGIATDGMEVSLSFADTQKNGLVANVVWDANSQLGKDGSKRLSEEIFNIMSDADEVASIMDKDLQDLDESVRTQVTGLSRIASEGGIKKQEALEAIERSLLDEGGGLIIGSARGEAAQALEAGLQRTGMETANDLFLKERKGTVLKSGLQEDFFAVGPQVSRKTTSAVDSAKTAAAQATRVVTDPNGKQTSNAIQVANILTEKINESPGNKRLLIGRLNRAKAGKEANKMLDFYNFHKPKVGIALAGLALTGIGYYISKKHRERQLYDETLQSQPTETARQYDSNMESKMAPPKMSLNSLRRDPLSTAGVVGNLDRAKIGHTRMGPRKDNHLFRGAM